MEWITEIAKEYGLFVALVVYVLFDARQRENKYIEREQEYISVIKSIRDIKDDVKEIKDKIFK